MRVPDRRAVRSIVVLVLAMAFVTGTAAGQSPATSPSPPPSGSPGALVVTLASTYLPGENEVRLELVRSMLQPGATLEGVRQAGTALSRVESGSITLVPTNGEVTVLSASEVSSVFRPGETHPVLAGQTILAGPTTAMTWRNDNDVPAVIITTRVIDAPWAAGGEPSEAAMSAPVVGRFVVVGPEMGGTRGRFTIKDRSGQVIGARLPTERELRFWSPVGSGAGPLSRVRSGVSELMLFWIGGVCGPIVTLDVAKDLRTITRRDRSPGCDAAATGHWLVLQLRGGWRDPARIRFQAAPRGD